jgi:hypothetical protein
MKFSRFALNIFCDKNTAIQLDNLLSYKTRYTTSWHWNKSQFSSSSAVTRVNTKGHSQEYYHSSVNHLTTFSRFPCLLLVGKSEGACEHSKALPDEGRAKLRVEEDVCRDAEEVVARLEAQLTYRVGRDAAVTLAASHLDSVEMIVKTWWKHKFYTH